MPSQDNQQTEPHTRPIVDLAMVPDPLFAQMLYVAAKLGIADQLRHGPKGVGELANAVDAHPGALYRVLRRLATLGIFAELGDKHFVLTPEAQCLRADVPNSLRNRFIMWGEAWWWRPHGELLHSVRTGQTAFDHVYGMRFFDYLERNSEASAIFNEGMSAATRELERSIIDEYDFSGFETVVDIGGGWGTLLTAILRANTHTRGVVFDRPPVIEGAKQKAEADGLSERLELVNGDFFTSIPARGDVYLLKDILHDWEDEKASIILKNCRTAMDKHAKLLVVERELPPAGEASPGKHTDVIMLVLTGGLERTQAEYQRLLKTGGFTLARRYELPMQRLILEAVPD